MNINGYFTGSSFANRADNVANGVRDAPYPDTTMLSTPTKASLDIRPREKIFKQPMINVARNPLQANGFLILQHMVGDEIEECTLKEVLKKEEKHGRSVAARSQKPKRTRRKKKTKQLQDLNLLAREAKKAGLFGRLVELVRRFMDLLTMNSLKSYGI